MVEVVALLQSDLLERDFFAAVQRLNRHASAAIFRGTITKEPPALLRHLDPTVPQAIILEAGGLGVEGEDPDAVPELVRQLLASSRPSPTVLWASLSWLRPRRMFTLGKMGLGGLIVVGESDSPEMIARTLSEITSSERAEAFIRGLLHDLPPDLERLIRSMVRPGIRAVPSARMAATLYCDRTTVYRKFSRAGLPPPRETVGWIRSYMVVRLSEEGLPLSMAASRMGFGTPSRFRTFLGRRLGHAAREVATVTSWCVLEALRNRCS